MIEKGCRLRIAFMDIFTNGGGIPVVAGRLIRGLCSQVSDVDVSLVFPFLDTLALLQINRPAKLHLIEMPMDDRIRYLSRSSLPQRLLLWGKLVFYGIKLGFALKKEHIDLIVFNLPKSGIVAWLSALICRARLLFYCHGVQFIDDIGLVYRFLLHRSYQVVAVSSGTKRQLTSIGIDGNKIEVIYNSIDITDQFMERVEARNILGLDQKALIIGCVGNIIRRKGIDILVKAFAELKKALNEGHHVLAIVGADTREQDGAFFNYVRSLIDENGLNEHVVFLGYRNDAAKLMRAFDLFVMPSRMESFGVAIIEAMAAGVPVIASRAGSIPEVIIDRKSGLLFESLNYRDLTEKIMSLLRDKDLRDSIVEAAISEVKARFTLENQIGCFRSLLTRRFLSRHTSVN